MTQLTIPDKLWSSNHDRELVVDRQKVTLISFKRLKTSPRSEGRCGKRQIERLTLELKAFCDSRGSIFIISLSKMIASEKASNSLGQLQSAFHATCLTNFTTIAKLPWQLFFFAYISDGTSHRTCPRNTNIAQGTKTPGIECWCSYKCLNERNRRYHFLMLQT